MITLIYEIEPSEIAQEVSWLYDMKVVPNYRKLYDWVNGREYMQVCVIVGPDAALAIKLRRPTKIQQEYRQR